MKTHLKQKLLKSRYYLIGLMFLVAGAMVFVKPATAAPANTAGWCFNQPLSQTFNCTDVTGFAKGSTTPAGFLANTCYIYSGELDQNELPVWVPQPDCSADAFANGPTCPPADETLTAAQAAAYCKTTAQTIQPCPDQPSGGCASLVTKYVQPIIDFLSAGVGIVIVIMIVVGGVRYSAAGDNPQAVQAAKGHIVNAIIALVIFGLMFFFLQWLVPGGIFH